MEQLRKSSFSGGHLENLLERLLVLEPEHQDTMNGH
jgi:hypothetical protein